jgi:hypothetical protein
MPAPHSPSSRAHAPVPPAVQSSAPPPPAIDPAMLGQLCELLVRSAASLAGPPLLVRLRDLGQVSVELEMEPVSDVRASLMGSTLGSEFHGLGCLVSGRARSLGDPVDGVPPGAVLGQATAALVVWRDGTTASCLRVAGGEPRVQVDLPGRLVGVECLGRLVDVVRRCLGLATSPPQVSVTDLELRVWLHRVLSIAADGVRVDAHTIDALAPPVPDSWEVWRRQRADGAWPELGVPPDRAAWMDTGMFAREAVSSFPDPAEVMVHLADLLAPDGWDHLSRRVAERRACPGSSGY